MFNEAPIRRTQQGETCGLEWGGTATRQHSTDALIVPPRAREFFPLQRA